MKKLLLVILFVFILITCSGCSDEELGYRQYPYIVVQPSFSGESIKLYIPLDENDYIYHSGVFENVENGIDLIIHFSKKGN